MAKLPQTIKEIPLIILIIILVGPLLILLSPVILVMFMLYGYDTLFQKLRKDPKVTFDEYMDESWYQSQTKDEFVAHFDAITKFLASHSGAKRSKTTVDGLQLVQTITSKSTSITARYTLEEHKNDKGIPVIYGDAADYDNDTGYIGLSCTATVGSEQIVVNTGSTNELWFLIGLLRGDIATKRDGKQLWVHIAEHDVWIVRYKRKKSSYGLRRNTNMLYARANWFDKK